MFMLFSNVIKQICMVYYSNYLTHLLLCSRQNKICPLLRSLSVTQRKLPRVPALALRSKLHAKLSFFGGATRWQWCRHSGTSRVLTIYPTSETWWECLVDHLLRKNGFVGSSQAEEMGTGSEIRSLTPWCMFVKESLAHNGLFLYLHHRNDFFEWYSIDSVCGIFLFRREHAMHLPLPPSLRSSQCSSFQLRLKRPPTNLFLPLRFLLSPRVWMTSVASCDSTMECVFGMFRGTKE